MTFEYCPKCGTKLEPREIGDEGLIPYCEPCSRPFFSFSYPCVIVAAVNPSGQIALIKQSYGMTNAFVCVAGYLKSDESAEDCVLREVSEEIGLTVTKAVYLKSYPLAVRDNLMLGFAAFVEDGDFKFSSEVKSAEWFSPQDAEKALWAGSIAQQVVQEYIARYLPAGANLQ